MNKNADVIIIGAGIIGAAIGYYLAVKGKKVIILEKSDLAAGATGSCDQFVVLQSKIPGIHLEIALESANLYKQLVRDLDQDLEYHASGGMIVIENETDLKVMEERVAKQCSGGLNVEILDIKEARKIQPELSEKLVGAVYCPSDAHVSSLKVTEAFLKEVAKKGGEVYNFTEVTDLIQDDDEVKGVITPRGEFRGDYVVNAAGVYAPTIGSMIGLEIPIKPRRGQLVVTEAIPEFVSQVTLSTKYLAAKHSPEILDNVSTQSKELGVGLAMEQTQKGNLLFGATREYVGFDNSVTREGILEIIKNAVTIYPRIKHFHIIRCFAGLRPATPDGLPILGSIDKHAGLIMAAGHEGDGICLAPITGRLISDYICGDNLAFDLEPFSIKRFLN